jgi:hypothetical protein
VDGGIEEVLWKYLEFSCEDYGKRGIHVGEEKE